MVETFAPEVQVATWARVEGRMWVARKLWAQPHPHCSLYHVHFSLQPRAMPPTNTYTAP